jgi:GTP-binding protein
VNTGTVNKDIINRGKTKFIMAIDSLTQLKGWWEHNQDIIGLAMVGRSNVGKSSLINALFGNKIAKISKTPGRTQKINIFTFQLHGDDKEYYLFDLPGYGHASVSKAMKSNWDALMGGFFQGLNRKTLLFNIQDARHPNQESDKAFYSFVNANEFEIYLIFNKIDKLKKQKERAALEKLKPHLYSEFKLVKQIFFVSAEKKTKTHMLEQSIKTFILGKEMLNMDLEVLQED